ncbi:hypothetical protein O181_088599, partial [Austropuccinia psidii MF-1]|nr:hypothetical protein [Austropuccinia psidii MF-1]
LSGISTSRYCLILITHTRSSYTTAYHPQTGGLAEIMIKALEDMIRRFCAHGLEFKYSDGFTHDFCTLISALEMAHKTLVHSSTASSFKIILDKVKHHEKQSIHYAFDYAKQKEDKSHKVPDFKAGALALVSTLSFNNIKGPKRLKYLYVGPFFIVFLHGTNTVQVEFSGVLENKHPTFLASLVKPYQPSDKELFHVRNPNPLAVPLMEQNEDKKIKKFIKERRISGKNQIEYLVRYRNLVHEDEWLA